MIQANDPMFYAWKHLPLVQRAVVCPYCGAAATLTNGAVVYEGRPDLAGKAIYQCAPCDARVGCHNNTLVPLGRMANATLRRAKLHAHAMFDPLWRGATWTRGRAYRWLRKELGKTEEECHIGLFNEEECRKVVELCKAKRCL